MIKDNISNCEFKQYLSFLEENANSKNKFSKAYYGELFHDLVRLISESYLSDEIISKDELSKHLLIYRKFENAGFNELEKVFLDAEDEDKFEKLLFMDYVVDNLKKYYKSKNKTLKFFYGDEVNLDFICVSYPGKIRNLEDKIKKRKQMEFGFRIYFDDNELQDYDDEDIVEEVERIESFYTHDIIIVETNEDEVFEEISKLDIERKYLMFKEPQQTQI